MTRSAMADERSAMADDPFAVADDPFAVAAGEPHTTIWNPIVSPLAPAAGRLASMANGDGKSCG
jgi:hypothetical protein